MTRIPGESGEGEGPCFGCASTVRERSACPDCGKVFCQPCAESPSLLGCLESCCDASEATACAEAIERVRDAAVDDALSADHGLDVLAALYALEQRDMDIESMQLQLEAERATNRQLNATIAEMREQLDAIAMVKP